MFSIIAIIFFLIKNIKKKFSYFNLFFLLASLNIILWIKNEGLVWAIIILTFFFLEIKKNKNKKIILILGIFLFVFLKYQIFNYYFSENLAGWKGYKFIALDKNFIETILERIPFIIYSIIKVFFKYPFLLIATLILFYEFLIKKNNTNLIIFLILNVVLSSSIFLLTNDVNWKFHTNVGLDRMIYQTSGFYILTIANFFRNMFSSFFGGNGKN